MQLKQRSINYFNKMPKGKSLYSHLLEKGYFPESWVLPPFLKTKLHPSGRGDTNSRNQVNLFAPKSNLKWREFSFLHPNNYEEVCRIISSQNFPIAIGDPIKGKKIFCYSYPQRFLDESDRVGIQIAQWNDLQEDLMSHSSEYSHVLIVDISNCYHSMYTHAIEWSCKQNGKKQFGVNLDLAVRRGMQNRTHGLPVGPNVTDYVAEIVLCAIDREIEKNSSNKSYIGGRYKDDYYLLCKSAADAESLLKIISKCLRSYNHSINSEKTNIFNTFSYFNNFWRIDYNALVSQFEFEIKNKVTKKVNIKNLHSFINLALRMSHSLGNERAVIEKSLVTLFYLRPTSIKYYAQYFTYVMSMYQNRIPALPKILLLLYKLSEEDKNCKALFWKFLKYRLKFSHEHEDEFEFMWIVYFMTLSGLLSRKILIEVKKTRHPLSKLISIYYEDVLNNKKNNKDLTKLLWPNEINKSKLTMLFDYPKDKDHIYKKLNVEFHYPKPF